MAKTVTVSNATELAAAVRAATVDTTIVLKAGNYGKLYLGAWKQPSLTDSSHLTIVSENPKKPAVFSAMEMVGVKNVTVDGVVFDYNQKSGQGVSHRFAFVENSKNITISNSVFDGDHASGLSNAANGYGTGTALSFARTDDVTVTDNTFFNFHRGLVVEKTDNLVVRDNEFSDMSSDGIAVSGIRKGTIEGNYIHDFDANPKSTAHKDMIQVRNVNETVVTQDLVIRGNILDVGAGVATQSIYVGNTQKSASMRYQNFTIEDNLIRNTHKNAITFSFIDGIKVKNNTVLMNDDQSGGSMQGIYVPAVNIANATKVTVSDNVLHAINGKYTGSNNLIVQRDDPNDPDYYGNLFVNALSDSKGTWVDLAPIPGGKIEQQGIGVDMGALTGTGGSSAPAPAPAPTPTASTANNVQAPASSADTVAPKTTGSETAVIADKQGTGLAVNEMSFDIASVLSGSGKKLSLSGAKVVWDYGDGSVGSGTSSTHAFDTPGKYDVTAIVTLKNGKTVVANKTVVAETPVLIETDFERSVKDLSGNVNGYKPNGSPSYVKDAGDYALKLKGGSIAYKTSPELKGNDAYTVLIDFRKLALSQTGKIIDFPGSFNIQVKDDELRVGVWTNGPDKTIVAKNIGIDDKAWHQLALTFDNKSGKATLYLDGAEVGEIGGFRGAVQNGGSKDFFVGSSGSGGFAGLVDNVWFLKGAMSQADVQNLHAGNATVDEIRDSYLNGGGGTTATATPTPAPSAPAPVSTPSPSTQAITVPDTGADETLKGTGRRDKLDGGAGDDSMYGRSGNDTMDGGTGDDFLFGNGGNDILRGEEGDDRIFGGGGNDKLFAGTGDDTLSSGGGRDTYVMERGFETATIIDFSDARDKIDVSAYNFSNLNAVLKTGRMKGGDAVFDLRGDTLIVDGFKLSDFDGNDFIV